MTAPGHIVIVGATSAIAEHCARLWAMPAPARISLVGRERSKLQRVADDLQVRSPTTQIALFEADFLDADSIREVVTAICADHPVDIVLIAHGVLPEQGQCQLDLNASARSLVINAVSPVLFAEAFAGVMANAGRGHLVIIGSVAGDRGRKSNYVYGAAKGLVARYAEGLQHRFAGSAVRVVLVKPGPTDTPMTAHLRGRGIALAAPEAVAAAIVRGTARGSRVIYAPGKWRWIMLVIRHLPNVIFARMDI